MDKAEAYAEEGRRKAQERQEQVTQEEHATRAAEKATRAVQVAGPVEHQDAAREIEQLSAQAAQLAAAKGSKPD